jgi:hypothetical protein
MEFGQQFLNFSKRAGFFYKLQSWDMGQIILLPLRRKASSSSSSSLTQQTDLNPGLPQKLPPAVLLWIFPAGKIRPTASVGSEPAILGTRGQHANH